MQTRLHQIYASGNSAGGDNVANIMVPYSGTIVAVQFSICSAQITSTKGEISFQSTNQLEVNDPTQILVSASNDFADLDTTGALSARAQSFVVGIAVPINSISKLYMHLKFGGAVTWFAKANIYIATK